MDPDVAKSACPQCHTANWVRSRSCRKCRARLAVAVLEILEGQSRSRAHYLRPISYTIGRTPDNDISIPDSSISRSHARVTFENNTFVIEDLRSRHGVLIGTERVTRATLDSGAVVQLGRVLLRFALLERRSPSDAQGV